MRVRVTIDLDESDSYISEELTSESSGAYGVDKDGVYRMWYGSRTDLVEFTNVKVLSDVKP